MSDQQSVVLHTSWRGRMAAAIAPAILITLGSYGIIVGGLQVLNGVITAIGLILAAVVVFDYPLTTSIGPEGVHRRCLLRTERLEWSRIRTIARPGARQRMVGFNRSALDTNEPRPAGRSGLVAEVGKRPHLLVDKVESRAEHEAIERGLRTWVPGMAFRASRPPEASPPTWLYKRRKSEIEGMVDWG